VKNLPDDWGRYEGDATHGVGECCDQCGDPLTGHNCSSCGELLPCDETGDIEMQLCIECADHSKDIEEALDDDLGATP
jgi:hypothetical protein